MDHYEDAIQLLNQMQVSTISNKSLTLINSKIEQSHNPLHVVIYEILYEELTEPILYHLENELGINSIRFNKFKTYNSSKNIDLEFSNPDVTFNSFMNCISIAEQLKKLYEIEKRVAHV